MEPRIIKTEEQYRVFLQEVERLALLDPDPESREGARLELLAKLVEDYEKERVRFKKPDPIDAILFRMQEQGLRQKDLADILGGKNRASEILSRKRPLTLQMIRALYERLSIPPDLLIREPAAPYQGSDKPTVADVPTELLIRRRWVEDANAVPDYLKQLFAPSGGPAFLRHTLTFGASARTNRTHVWLWLARVRQVADSSRHLQGRFRRDTLNDDLLQYVAKLSWMEKGPRRAKEFLEERGIALVIEPHLPHTHLDGAAMIGRGGTPIVALTLREDRLDNFWFTLLHELVHVWKHLDRGDHKAIADENIERFDEDDKIEQEANAIASEILLPRSIWRRSEAFGNPSVKSIIALAAERQISPAVVAGRVRFERRNYALFSKLVGYRQVRAQFPEVTWS